MTEPNKKCCSTVFSRVGFILFFILLGVGLFFFLQHESKENAAAKAAAEHYATWLETPKPIQPFKLQSTLGGDFTEQGFQDHWSLVFFGFTSCPDMCPNAMKAFKTMTDKLRSDNITPLPQVLFVSIDPTRDTMSVLQKYVTAFDPSFIGLRGDMDQVNILAKQMNVSITAMPNGMFQHSGTVTAVNPDGAIQAYFPWTDDPIKIAEDYEAMVKIQH